MAEEHPLPTTQNGRVSLTVPSGATHEFTNDDAWNWRFVNVADNYDWGIVEVADGDWRLERHLSFGPVVVVSFPSWSKLHATL